MDVATTLFDTDPEILLDVQNLSQNDSHKVLRRLDTLCRQQYFSRITNFKEDDVKRFLSKLVESYLKCSESIKISRAVEKLWQPFTPNYGSFIETCFEGYIMKVIQEKLKNLQHVSKFSVLLEQNRMVQQIVKRNLLDVVCWLSQELPPMLLEAPVTLSVSQSQFIYALVKIILQLFQVCPAEMGDFIWEDNRLSCTVTEKFQNAGRVVCSNLLYILCHTGYQTDCVLLAGTAASLMLNTSRTALLAEKAFFSILQATLNKDCECDFDDLLHVNRNTSMTMDRDRFSKLTENDMGKVAFIRGVIACGSNDILFRNMGSSTFDQSDPPLCITLFNYITSICQGNITLHYHSFQILLLWYTRITKISLVPENVLLTDQICSIIRQTHELLILNWDSPVEDVAEAVVDIFDHMMSLWSRVKVQMPDFPQNVMENLLSTAWFVKGKYRVFAILLKYVDHEKILEEFLPGIQSQLLKCLTTNHLASAATSLYKGFLTQLQKLPKKSQSEKWQCFWMDTVLQGLISENSLLRYNTCLHWVPVTLKIVPESGDLLQDKLITMMGDKDIPICYTRRLHAWTVVSKTVRAITGSVDLSNVYVREALHCLDEDVRSEAISMICTTLKKAEPISDTEISLIKEALTHNIKIDSAPFRQHLGSDLRKLLTRLRDSCITLLKSPEKNSQVLESSLDFVDWLHRLCIDYVLPGSCYQRRKGSLDLLHVLYECLIYRPDDKQRKGFTPDTAKDLVNFAVKKGKWDFFNIENIHVLILCILDSANEIQSSAFSLLTKYYTFLDDEASDTSNSLCCHLIREFLKLCNSPKGHESESGSVLCKLVFQKYILSQSISCSFTYNEDSSSYNVNCYRKEQSNKLDFVDFMIEEMKKQLELANENLVKASKQYPIHGLILAVTRCLTETPDLLDSVDHAKSVSTITALIEVCEDVIQKMLSVMARVAGQEACPSFAEIGVALETLLQESQSDYTESTSQSPEFQYMLSWCWNNINESCSCLGDLTEAVVQNRLPVTYTVIERISSTFITVLTKCRHKGVIEGCRTAFVKFCSALFSSDKEEFYKLPAKILSQVLTSLKNNVMSSSITRRSAGLPIIVQAVLVSEKKIKKIVLLKSSILTLLEIAQLPLEADSGQTDLPQVHSLNILNTIFSDASLSGSLTGHISQAVMLVITKFGSPSWAVRNAATRFFSTLVTRIFGQRKSSDTSFCNTVIFQEFSSYYPELPPFLLTLLSEATKRKISDISQIHPSLFPVLTLLSCLNPSDTVSETLRRDTEKFREKTLPFLASPVYQLRHLVASALVSMVNMSDMMMFAEEVLEQCPAVEMCNQLHGNLLFILQLTNYVSGQKDVERLWHHLMELQGILDCVPIVSSVYVQLLTCLIQKHTYLSLPGQILLKVEKCCCANRDVRDVGDGIFVEKSVNLLFLCTQSATNDEKFRLVQTLLSSPSQDTRKACLEYLILKGSGELISWSSHVLKILCHSLKKETYIPNLCTMFQLITSLYLNRRLVDSDSISEVQNWFNSNSKIISQYVSLNAAMLPVWGIVVQHGISDTDILENIDAVKSWCHCLLENTTVTNETQRFSVTQALLTAGQAVLDWTSLRQYDNLSSATVSVLHCCSILVQDEDTGIRQEACRFISNLRFETDITLFKYDSLHSNICYELLLEYTVRHFHFSSECVVLLIDQLYSQGQIVKVMDEKKTARFQQLFDQEDNSFFAEKIYNGFSLYRSLKNGMTQFPDSLIKSCVEEYGQYVSSDMDIVMDLLHTCDKGSLINICSDNTVLASICSILLMGDLIDSVHLRDKLTAVLQMDRLPKNLRRNLTHLVDQNIWYTCMNN